MVREVPITATHAHMCSDGIASPTSGEPAVVSFTDFDDVAASDALVPLAGSRGPYILYEPSSVTTFATMVKRLDIELHVETHGVVIRAFLAPSITPGFDANRISILSSHFPLPNFNVRRRCSPTTADACNRVQHEESSRSIAHDEYCHLTM
ncbi:MAG: hypothetical protein OXG15_11880 [Gammaproteobacteria bacterium]|nr:hypothetical protein [Gammaproteobacteria bacterium]